MSKNQYLLIFTPLKSISVIFFLIQYDGSNIQKLITFLSDVSPMKIPSLKGPICGTKIEVRRINYKSNE